MRYSKQQKIRYKDKIDKARQKTGMALATPIQKLLEILEQSELVESRQVETAVQLASLEKMY